MNVHGNAPVHQREEFHQARRSMAQLVPLLKQGYEKIILTHGNGPQVGQIFRQQELTLHEFPRQITLDVCVADSQGRIGYIMQNVFDNVCQQHGIDKKSFSVITQVVVDPKDPGFDNPSKPIGVFYSKEEADQLAAERGWILREDSGRGYRRVVPSPKPLQIVEKNIFHQLLDMGLIAIGAGGGGIPVIRTPEGQLEGIEAVIDKDRTRALLASEVDIDCTVILTQVDPVFRCFNTPQQRPIHEATPPEMEA